MGATGVSDPKFFVRKLGFLEWEAKIERASYTPAFGSGFTRAGAIRDARRRWHRRHEIDWEDVNTPWEETK
jgi:hypothetical protein